MEEVKVWALQNGYQATELSKTSIGSEKKLEDILVKNPDMLLPGLKLVGRQTPTDGGPLDLLGVDQTGRLVVFELKRHTAYRDAVAQVIDYASAIENMGNDKLVALIAEHSGKNGIQKIDDFRNWYADSLEQGDSINSEQLDELLPPRMVLVGLGADAATERTVKHSNLDISLLTFHSFMHNDQTLFAKQVEVLSSAARRQRGKPSPEEIKVELRRKAENPKLKLRTLGPNAQCHGIRVLIVSFRYL